MHHCETTAGEVEQKVVCCDVPVSLTKIGREGMRERLGSCWCESREKNALDREGVLRDHRFGPSYLAAVRRQRTYIEIQTKCHIDAPHCLCAVDMKRMNGVVQSEKLRIG